jgi:hypothetical protein
LVVSFDLEQIEILRDFPVIDDPLAGKIATMHDESWDNYGWKWRHSLSFRRRIPGETRW